MFLNYEPGDYVINPEYKSWGIGQIQSIINNKEVSVFPTPTIGMLGIINDKNNTASAC